MKLPFVLVFFFWLAITQGQYDLNNYSGLKSHGKIPDDFTTNTVQKYGEDVVSNRKKETKEEKLDKEFLLNTNYEIDRMLHGGTVVFNDPVSNFANKVLDQLLIDNPDLRKQLRLYTIKSNVPNAFCTRQGIIFVTTGLVSKLETEAQLAFILSHEITHYVEQHVTDSYREAKIVKKGKGKYKLTSKDEKIKILSNFSKEKELVADEAGLDLFSRSPYSYDGVMGTFKVLKYSYLPFEEKVFDHTYFNDEALYIPENFFPDSINPITAVDDFDDSKSSHPNLKTRKENIEGKLADFKKMSNDRKTYVVGQKEFEEIRTLCRFESVEQSVVHGYPGSALYSIYILRDQYPDSYFLDKMEALAWYKLLKYKNAGLYSGITYYPSDVEGESSPLHYMLDKLSSIQINAVALKRIYAINEKYGRKKSYLNMILADAIDDALRESGVFNDLSGSNYKEVYETHFGVSISNTNKSSLDSTKLANWDEDDFYKYAFADILDDGYLQSLKDDAKEKETEGWEDLDPYSGHTTKKSYKAALRAKRWKGDYLGIDKMLIMSPEFKKFDLNSFNKLKSEKGSVAMGEIYNENCERLGLEGYKVVDKKSYSNADVQELNDLHVIQNYIGEFLSYASEMDHFSFYPSMYDKVLEISDRRNIDHVLLPYIVVEEQPRFVIVDYILLFYPFYWPYFAIKGSMPANDITIVNVVFNIRENKITHLVAKNFGRKFNNPSFVGAHIYDILFQLSSEKKGGKNEK